jgi:hypothetical protein
MAVYYFDSSALVKRYVLETGTLWVQAITDPHSGNRHYILTITAVEVTSAVMKREREGSLSAALRQAILSQFDTDYANQYRILDVLRSLIDEARILAERYGLRAYDTVQLAGVLQAHRERVAKKRTALYFVSADDDLNAAAVAEGMIVENPNSHP